MNEQSRIQDLLEQGLESIKLHHLSPKLLQYLILLNKWNLTYNLTAVRDLENMVYKHVLDSLAILPWLKGLNILDVGTGAGLPGIPLAIARPDLQFTLLDSNGKKTRFLNEIKHQLNLNNLKIAQIRAENYHPEQAFDTVVSRAFSSLEQMLYWTQHLIASDGIWLAMKGRYPESELSMMPNPYKVETYSVEGIDGDRCCVIIENTTKESLWQK